MKVATTWTRVPGTPNYESGDFVAIYDRTHPSGQASFRVFPRKLAVSKRTPRAALSVGGLPSYVEVPR